MEERNLVLDKGENIPTLSPELLKCIPAEQCNILANLLKDTPHEKIFKELANTPATIRFTMLLKSIQDMSVTNKEVIINEVRETYNNVEKDLEESIQQANKAILNLKNVLIRHESALEKCKVVNQIIKNEGLMSIETLVKNTQSKINKTLIEINKPISYPIAIKENNINKKITWAKVANTISNIKYTAPPSPTWCSLAGRVDIIPILIRGAIAKKSKIEVLKEIKTWDIDMSNIINIDRLNPITLELIIKQSAINSIFKATNNLPYSIHRILASEPLKTQTFNRDQTKIIAINRWKKLSLENPEYNEYYNLFIKFIQQSVLNNNIKNELKNTEITEQKNNNETIIKKIIIKKEDIVANLKNKSEEKKQENLMISENPYKLLISKNEEEIKELLQIPTIKEWADMIPDEEFPPTPKNNNNGKKIRERQVIDPINSPSQSPQKAKTSQEEEESKLINSIKLNISKKIKESNLETNNKINNLIENNNELDPKIIKKTFIESINKPKEKNSEMEKKNNIEIEAIQTIAQSIEGQRSQKLELSNQSTKEKENQIKNNIANKIKKLEKLTNKDNIIQ